MGKLAAFSVAICWALTSIFFGIAGREIGSAAVNRMRLLFATILLGIMHFFLVGSVYPFQASANRFFWLGLSGLIGLVLGDAFLFQAFVQVGARISTLIMASVPVISALIAWLFLGENLSLLNITGIIITVGGIALVIYEDQNNGQDIHPKDRSAYLQGILFAFLGAIGQAVGLVLQKKGGGGEFPSISSVLIRVSLGAVIMWIIALFQHKAKSTMQDSFTNKTSLKFILLGTIVGPFAGIWLSMVAVQSAYVGIASTLMALTPIVMLPISFFLFKEKISSRALLGTFISMIGVAIIFILR